ncbi:MAG: four helix bundle protein [Ignavibacteriae bacterium]|nr:four helix bundle protein [Ignavibacteriota bacterium]
MKKTISSYEDLEVYQKLVELHLKVYELTLSFPKFEMYELGSQLRRSSNSAPANVAEGWNNKNLNIYLEGINRAQGELRETIPHLTMAFRKCYFSDEKFKDPVNRYNECGKMLSGLENSLERYKNRNNPNS